jgi:hypothetical protein
MDIHSSSLGELRALRIAGEGGSASGSGASGVGVTGEWDGKGGMISSQSLSSSIIAGAGGAVVIVADADWEGDRMGWT